MMPLGLMKEGEEGVVVEIRDQDSLQEFENHEIPLCSGGCLFCKKERQKFKKVFSLGLRPGIRVLVRKNKPGQPIIIFFENTQLALSRGLAMKIFVKKT
jgi:Fe2+ transport system protein FeoA